MGLICFCVSPENVSEIPTLNANLISMETEGKGQIWRFQDSVVGMAIDFRTPVFA